MYYRYRSHRDPRDLPVMTAAACILCVIVFLAINMDRSPGGEGLARWGLLPEAAIYRGAYWSLISSAFVHIQLIHLAFNLMWLWPLGGALERVLGWWKWLIFVFAAAFVSSGLQLLTGHSGIGMSGVVYAMFGFAWLTRRRFPEFTAIANQKNAQVMVGWAILCVFLTYAGALNVGNAAHFGGLFVGAALGAMVDNPRLRWPMSFTVAALAAVSVVPLFWNPLSSDWVTVQAENAFARRDWPEAARLYRRAMAMGEDPEWAWSNLARIYGNARDPVRFKDALEHLRTLNSEEAKTLQGDYGIN